MESKRIITEARENPSLFLLIVQADISKLENGSANPSLRTLRRLAEGMGMQIKLEFVPASK